MTRTRSSSSFPCARKPKSPRRRNKQRARSRCKDRTPQGRLSLERKGNPAYSAKDGCRSQSRTRKGHLTQNQLHELLDTDQAKALVEGAEERGHLEAAELEAFALEHDLNEAEVEELTRELERIGLDVRAPEAEAKEVEKEEKPAKPEPHVLSGSADSLQLFLADVGRHKLLTAAEEV